jgi:hypothetical protein
MRNDRLVISADEVDSLLEFLAEGKPGRGGYVYAHDQAGWGWLKLDDIGNLIFEFMLLPQATHHVIRVVNLVAEELGIEERLTMEDHGWMDATSRDLRYFFGGTRVNHGDTVRIISALALMSYQAGAKQKRR